jgi:hypothetical protein
VYRAPSDFIRTDSNTNAEADSISPLVSNITHRNVALTITDSSGGSNNFNVGVVRPPVMLVHGLWASSSDLGDLTDLENLGMVVGRVNYGNKINIVSRSLSDFSLNSTGFNPAICWIFLVK